MMVTFWIHVADLEKFKRHEFVRVMSETGSGHVIRVTVSGDNVATKGDQLIAYQGEPRNLF